jgi:hypothetical protein
MSSSERDKKRNLGSDTGYMYKHVDDGVCITPQTPSLEPLRQHFSRPRLERRIRYGH